MLRVYLVRHGQTDWNLERRLQGSTDVPLNATGHEQARALAEAFEGITFDSIYCSTLSRSRETAQALAHLGDIEELEELAEQSLGELEGRVLTEPGALEAFREWLRTGRGFEGGESLEQHAERVSGAWERIRAAHEAGTVLIVGHGGTNAQLIRAILGLGPTDELGLRQQNGEILLLEVPAGAPARLWRQMDPSQELAGSTPGR